jgi:iron complex outermembrane recepter protein
MADSILGCKFLGYNTMSNRSGLRPLDVAVRTTLGLASLAIGSAAFAQQAQQDQEAVQGEVEEIVVTGFRESLSKALELKKDQVGAVDAIVAEDIADFPDLNLAESIQRVPGVSIARDAGEGRQISVRGLGPQFTRVRINGMEAMSANGGTDAAGGTNRDRSFDFNTFASELFNSITVRKTSAAEIEEGSLGATVDLRSARPFDYDGFTVVTGAQAAYNDIQEDIDPRAAFLISNTFADGRFGALMSVAYTERKLLDEGTSTVRWQNGSPNTNPAGVDPAEFGSLATGYTAAPSLAQLNSAFRPRIPRYDIYEHDQERLGITGSLQFQATDNTQLSLDAMYAKFDATRSEIFLEAPVFSSNGAAGINNVQVRDAVIDNTNTLVYGVFDNVDIRSEQRYDELETEFTHLTLEGEHTLTETVRLKGLVGYSEATHDNPIQTTLLFDRNDVDGYSYDFRGNDRLPLIAYGNANVADPNAWTLTQIRLRPQSSENTFQTVSFDVAWDVNELVTLKAGPQYKKFEFETASLVRSNGSTASQEGTIPTNVRNTPIANYSELARLSGNLNVPNGTPTSWIVPNIDAAGSMFGLYDRSLFPLAIGPALGNNYQIEEEDLGGYVQADLNTEVFGRTLRANVGVRYVETTQTSSGFTFSAGSPLLTTVERTYDDTLPSFNVSYDLTDELVVRAAAAKVMVRPNGSGTILGLGVLAPGAAVTIGGANKTVTAGNPNLDPYRAKAYDLAVEWYFAEDSLLSAAVFYKDITSFVQIIRSTDNFSNNTLGLPDSVALGVCGTAIPDPATCLSNWQFSLPTNTDGGDLTGFEISYQQPFSFLPGFWSNFGLLLNYTGVESEIDYVDQTGAVVVRTDLTGLSKSAYNATLYWENEVFSARVSAAYRDEFLTTVPGRNGNNVEGTAETLGIDASTKWSVTPNLDLTLEALNLTDEFQDQYVDSNGDRLSYYHHQGRQYLLGARYKF